MSRRWTQSRGIWPCILEASRGLSLLATSILNKDLSFLIIKRPQSCQILLLGKTPWENSSFSTNNHSIVKLFLREDKGLAKKIIQALKAAHKPITWWTSWASNSSPCLIALRPTSTLDLITLRSQASMQSPTQWHVALINQEWCKAPWLRWIIILTTWWSISATPAKNSLCSRNSSRPKKCLKACKKPR